MPLASLLRKFQSHPHHQNISVQALYLAYYCRLSSFFRHLRTDFDANLHISFGLAAGNVLLCHNHPEAADLFGAGAGACAVAVAGAGAVAVAVAGAVAVAVAVAVAGEADVVCGHVATWYHRPFFPNFAAVDGIDRTDLCSYSLYALVCIDYTGFEGANARCEICQDSTYPRSYCPSHC